ncbi:MAG: hypothetical protein KDA65_05445 [Planctomycetaceae bacterium]|nr:hypothetical protein [Planctomycetaceae bacterium]
MTLFPQIFYMSKGDILWIEQLSKHFENYAPQFDDVDSLDCCEVAFLSQSDYLIICNRRINVIDVEEEIGEMYSFTPNSTSGWLRFMHEVDNWTFEKDTISHCGIDETSIIVQRVGGLFRIEFVVVCPRENIEQQKKFYLLDEIEFPFTSTTGTEYVLKPVESFEVNIEVWHEQLQAMKKSFEFILEAYETHRRSTNGLPQYEEEELQRIRHKLMQF